MTYATPLDIRQAVAPDGNVTGTCGELGDDQIQRQINRGQQLVDAYTGVVFTDANVPELVAGLVIALAAYYSTLAYRKGLTLEAGHPVLLMYQDAQNTLQGIKTGIIKFEPDAPDTDTTPVRVKPKVINTGPLNQAMMFTLEDAGLVIRTGECGPPTIDPGLHGMEDGVW